MQYLHRSSLLFLRLVFRLVCPSLALVPLMVCYGVQSAPSVGVRNGVNCPGAYQLSGSGKVCQAQPDYLDILYLGENSRQSCKLPYTRVNAGDSKWCVKYLDQ